MKPAIVVAASLGLALTATAADAESKGFKSSSGPAGFEKPSSRATPSYSTPSYGSSPSSSTPSSRYGGSSTTLKPLKPTESTQPFGGGTTRDAYKKNPNNY